MDTNKKPNRLISEKSPYLLQHAYNPVDWFPWGEEAFSKAEKEDKVVFLSIGYATCHWCHVMERESFEDENTAALLNENFVCIKVDREERPDIDKIYMDALHAMEQQGGWPLNMFLTPKGKPITGGTYFPPTAKFGRKSFSDVLAVIHSVWTERKEELVNSAESLAHYLKSEELREKSDTSLPAVNSFENAFRMYDRFYDENYYGFKTNNVNKFPPSMGLSFLMRYYFLSSNQRALDMVENTLKAMKKGGIYDQIGGGLCRYATDGRWLVPHFEKMLYDNSLFITALTECYQLTGDDFYKTAVYDIVSYIRRDMTLSTGAIASAEDADSEGEEGKFYIWTLDEFKETCGEDSSILEKYWNITDDGNFEGHNILNESFMGDFAKEYGIAEEELKEKILVNRKKLLEKRSNRIRPLRDDKVLTSWNSLYIQAISFAGRVFEDETLIADAKKIYDFIQANLFDSNGRLLRRYREGESRFKAYLTDYAELGLAGAELFKATGELVYLKNAKHLAEEAIRLFKSEKGPFFDTGIDGEELIRRSIDGYDGVEPSGNSSMAHLLNYLSSLGIETARYDAVCESIFKYFSLEIAGRAISYPSMLSAYLFRTSSPRQIIVYGKKHHPEIIKINQFLNSNFLPSSVVIYTDSETNEKMEELIPLLKDKNSDKEVVIYVCKDSACELPVYSYKGFLERLKTNE